MSLSLHIHGAAGTVTGSCHRLVTPRGTLLVDCGMFQGPKTEKELNYRVFPFDPRSLDALVLTHGHILKEVWGPGSAQQTHYLRVYMGNLRRKLEDDPSRPAHLVTETGVGYRLRV